MAPLSSAGDPQRVRVLVSFFLFLPLFLAPLRPHECAEEKPGAAREVND